MWDVRRHTTKGKPIVEAALTGRVERCGQRRDGDFGRVVEGQDELAGRGDGRRGDVVAGGALLRSGFLGG